MVYKIIIFQLIQFSAIAVEVWGHSSWNCGLPLTTNLLKHMALLVHLGAPFIDLASDCWPRLAVQIVHNALMRPRNLPGCCHATIPFHLYYLCDVTIEDMLFRKKQGSRTQNSMCLMLPKGDPLRAILIPDKPSKMYSRKKWQFLSRGNVRKVEGRVRLSDGFARGLVTGQSVPGIYLR